MLTRSIKVEHLVPGVRILRRSQLQTVKSVRMTPDSVVIASSFGKMVLPLGTFVQILSEDF